VELALSREGEIIRERVWRLGVHGRGESAGLDLFFETARRGRGRTRSITARSKRLKGVRPSPNIVRSRRVIASGDRAWHRRIARPAGVGAAEAPGGRETRTRKTRQPHKARGGDHMYRFFHLA